MTLPTQVVSSEAVPTQATRRAYRSGHHLPTSLRKVAIIRKLALALVLSSCATVGAHAANAKSLAASLAAMRDQPQHFVVIAVDNPNTARSTRAGSTLRGYDAVAPYGATRSARSAVAALERTYRLSAVAAWPINTLKLHCVVFRIPSDSSLDSMLEQLRQDSLVKLAQPLQHFNTVEVQYNDPYIGLQSSFQALGISRAHQLTTGVGIDVAIIDTGIDAAHPDLKGSVIQTQNFIDNDKAQFFRDIHGTEVAGVIAAKPNNRLGMVGIAPGVRLHALKACWQIVSDAANARCDSFTLAQALAAAIDARVDIVNISISGPADPLLDALIAQGIRQGIVFVGAVAPDGNLLRFPVGTHGVIAVETAEHAKGTSQSLPAPGVEILTLLPNGRYDFASGPSLATANISGIVALILQTQQHTVGARLEQLLQRSRIAIDTTERSQQLISACAAIAQLNGTLNCFSNEASALPRAPVAAKR